MSLYIPRLRRAVSNFLQLPLQDAPLAFEIIEESLYDARTVNSVYHLLISQASREPCKYLNFLLLRYLFCFYSPNLISKAVQFMLRYLLKFPPSADTLKDISQFYLFVLKKFRDGWLHAQSDLERSLHFLQTLVGQVIADSQLVTANSYSMDDLIPSLRPSILRSEKSWDNPSNGFQEDENGEISSLGQSSRMGSNTNFPAANSISGYSNSSIENPILPIGRKKTPPIGAPCTPARKMETSRALLMNSIGSGIPMINDAQFHRRSRSWSLAEQFVQEMLKFRPPLVWMTNSGNRNPSESEDDAWQTVMYMRGLLCTDHLWTVVDLQKEAITGETRRTGSNVMGSGPLFQYRNYQEQESLQLSSKEIPVVVDTVCGNPPGESVWGDMDLNEIWDSTGDKCIGEACVAILVKLIMDMYIEYGPAASYLLVLQMLSRSLQNEDASVRSRAFDLIYNLSLHSLMMFNVPDDTFFEQPDLDHPADKGPVKRLKEINPAEKSTVIKLQTLNEEVESGTNHKKADIDPMLQMMPWVRSLLFDLMILLDKSDERDVSVWSAAISCFVHLTTANGEFVSSLVENLPISILVKALRISIESGWADEIYSHLLRLLIKLLYRTPIQGIEGRVVDEDRLDRCGGIREMLFHLRTTRSMLDASLLVELILDYTSMKCQYSTETMAPLLSNLLSPSAMDVIVARCRHGEMGIGDVLHVALQNCIIEKNAVHDSPKKPVHHRYRSHSSLLSSDTVTTIQPGVDPDALDSWQTILSHIDEHLCPSQPQELPLDILETLGDPAEPNQDAFVYLKDILHSHFHEQRIQGMHWVREWAFSRLEYCLRQEDRSFMSLLPEPKQEGSIEEENGHENNLENALYQWVSLSDNAVGIEMTLLMEELVTRLTIHSNQKEIPSEISSRCLVFRMGTILFRTMHSGLKWIRLLPKSSKLRPLLSMGFLVCQVIHAPHNLSDITSTPPHIDGLTSLPSPYIFHDYIFGTGAVYARLLRLAPIDFLLDLISSLEEYCPKYHLQVGFFGRPGHKGDKHSPVSIPWTDSVSDLRSALVLLLLHRCSMDSKGKGRLEEICSGLMEDADVRVRYVASRHLLKYVMEERSAVCRAALRLFVAKAQQMNNERLIDNPYLQVQHIRESGVH